jgi:SAM-dependent methyltransferase
MEHAYYAEYRTIEERHWWFIGRRTVLLRVLGRCLNGAGGERRILDVGCGTGAMLQQLAAFGTVDGLDADETAVRFCRERGLARVELLSSDRLPKESGSFDLVTALDVLEHVDDDRSLLLEVARVLRPDGAFLLTVPAYEALWGPQDEVSHHRRRYRAGQVRERVEGAGLRVVKLSYFNTLLFPPIAAVRLLRPRLPGKPRELQSDFTMTKPGRVNDLLARVFAAEAALVERWNLPFGVSILALAVKDRP